MGPDTAAGPAAGRRAHVGTRRRAVPVGSAALAGPPAHCPAGRACLMSSTTPLSYLSAAGKRADSILALTWFTLAVSIMVCLIIAALLWAGTRRARVRTGIGELNTALLTEGGRGTSWIGVGLL